MDARRQRMFTAALAAALFATAALAADSYRWTDEETGEFIYSPTPPVDQDQPYVMIRDGVVIRSFDGAERFDRPDEKEAQRRAEEAQRKSDALLLVQYPTAEDIDRAMEAELDNLSYDFNLLDGTYDSLEKSLFELIRQAADRERAGLSIAPHQAQQITSIRTRMGENRTGRMDLEAREKGIRSEYDKTRERYQRLKAGLPSP